MLVGRETESGGGPTDLFALARQPDGGGRRGGGDRGSAVTGAGVFEAAAACRRRAGGDDHGRVRAAAVARILRGAWCVRAPGGTDLADRHDHRASPMGCRRNRTHRRREGSINNQNRRPCRDLGRQRRFPVDAPGIEHCAAMEAVSVALTLWIGMAAVAATLFTATHTILDRIRDTGWQRDIDNLVCHGDGHTTRNP